MVFFSYFAMGRIETRGRVELLTWSSHPYCRDLISAVTLSPKLREQCLVAFQSTDGAPSKLQTKVASMMREMSYAVEEEVRTDIGYTVDCVVTRSKDQARVYPPFATSQVLSALPATCVRYVPSSSHTPCLMCLLGRAICTPPQPRNHTVCHMHSLPLACCRRRLESRSMVLNTSSPSLQCVHPDPRCSREGSFTNMAGQ